ncbi:DHA2 family efflux MFS transporter permease subunit [uncultured Corynebacterium sp.]|uniref:DHA2 family efflux MFS transporter permease subunit n=1 Tax=uncultured Corynebacterium sp. TaxID=159447 RepID=UPI0025F87FD9|nr:DHA2 family efflux MFS transporter permease subunit [uncultured Corynebacterium sp.]
MRHDAPGGAETAVNHHLPPKQAYLALFALCVGFFMNLLDQSIVAVATPDIMEQLGADYASVIWVTSAYLLAYAVPLLVTGRLGDQFGQKRIYQVGMVLFTVSSLACGLAESIETLVAARFAQGLGASLIGPQTLAIITRIFPPERRGAAMGWWGTVAGLATLTGPLLGGFLTTSVGWEWIFYVNIPFGILSMVLVARWVPDLPSTSRTFDLPGIAVSTLAMSGLVFGLQQGQAVGWAPWIWAMLVGSAVLFGLFVRLQATAPRRGVEALVPLRLFDDPNFARGALSISTMAFVTASNALPIMIFVQTYDGLSAFQAGLLVAPMALLSGVLAPWVGSKVERTPANLLSMIGFGSMIVGHVVLFGVLRESVPSAWIAVAVLILGVGNAFVWGPNSTITLRGLDTRIAGAGSGVYNATRQVGAVLGAAATAAFIEVGRAMGGGSEIFGQSLLLHAAVLCIGFFAVAGFRRPAATR